MTGKIKRVAIIGPESSGKSELCMQLAKHYHTQWIPEYARQYLTQLNKPYTLQDVVEIYKTQFFLESQLINSSSKYIFVDTEFIIAKVWCEHVFKSCPPYIDEMIAQHSYDLYLLTAPDLPWEYDPLREHPGQGTFFFEWYEHILKKNNLTFKVVSGSGDLRTACAIALIEEQFTGDSKF